MEPLSAKTAKTSMYRPARPLGSSLCGRRQLPAGQISNHRDTPRDLQYGRSFKWNRNLAVLTFSAAIVLSSTTAMTQTPVEDRLNAIAETVITGCVDDLVTHCSSVTAGEGRVIACIYAHEDKLSGRCTATLNDVRLRLHDIQSMVGYAAGQCLEDVEKHCSNVETGDGRLIRCLRYAGKAVSEKCRTEIDHLTAE